MKIYVIASSEYEANMPDLFLMDTDSNYYGVSMHSYARWKNFPKGISYWMNAEGSDAGRYFYIDEVELPQEQVEEFDHITKEYNRLDEETPNFDLPYPSPRGYKTKKAYNEAVNEYMKARSEWCKASNIAYYINTKNDLWKQRTKLFISFSEKVYEGIKDNHCIMYH